MADPPQRSIDRILAWLAANRHDQVYFADEMKVSKASVTNWIKRGMPPRMVPKASQVTGIPVSELMGMTPVSKHSKERGTDARWPLDDFYDEFVHLNDEQKAHVVTTVKTLFAGYRTESQAQVRRKKSIGTG